MNRHRSLVMALACMGLAAQSCQVMVPVLATDKLPSQASTARAPTSNEDDTLRSGVSAGVLAESVSEEPAVLARIRSELERRHTRLATHEIQRLAKTIVEEARRHGLDADLVMAVIHVESAGQPLAVSNVGAMGLMQLLPSTGEELARKHGIEWHGPVTLFDSVVNVKLGTAYLHQLVDRYGDISTALAAYNWGPGRIDRRLRRGAAVPSHYPQLVMKAYDARGATPARRS